VPEAGTLLAPRVPYMPQSELDRLDANIANREKTRDRRTEAHEKQAKRVALFTRTRDAVDDALSKLIAANPRAVLSAFESQHELDEPSPDEVKRYFAEVTAATKVIEDLGRMRPRLTDEEIEELVGPPTPALTLAQPTYAQRASALTGVKPLLKWTRSPAAEAVILGFGGVPAEGAADAIALGIWLFRDRIVEELKRQAAALAEQNGVLTPKEYRVKLAEAKAAKYLAELETAAAWWRCREAGFDTVPPPVSGRALLLIAPE
jgi:hypothetical protein